MPAPSNVRLLLRGLLVLSAREGQPTGKVAFLKTPPAGHDLTIKITKQPPVGPQTIVTLNRPQIREDLQLNIVPIQPNITFRNRNPVNRNLAIPTEQDSVRWFVDLENSELYGFPIGANPTEFRPLLTFNSGALFTQPPLSESLLLVQRGIFSNYETFGRVALTLGVDFISATSAVFKNGATTVFDSSTEAGTNYLIEITHDAAQHPAVVTDANNYYKALGAGIPPEQRILFMSLSNRQVLAQGLEEARLRQDTDRESAMGGLLTTLGPPAGPEAACFPAYLGNTNIG